MRMGLKKDQRRQLGMRRVAYWRVYKTKMLNKGSVLIEDAQGKLRWALPRAEVRGCQERDKEGGEKRRRRRKGGGERVFI